MCLYDISYVLHFGLVLINDELLGMPFTCLFEVSTSHICLFNVFFKSLRFFIFKMLLRRAQISLIIFHGKKCIKSVEIYVY